MKNILITGCSSGVGYAISEFFIKKGWRVLGLSRNISRLEKMKEDLGINFYSYPVDISDSDAVEKCFEMIKISCKKIDLLVNNAGIFLSKPCDSLSIKDVDRVIDTNLKGLIYTTLLSLPLLRYGSRIVYISSVSGQSGIINQSIYSASKFGVNGFFESISQELQTRGILGTAICPGGINTELWNPLNPYSNGSTKDLLQPMEMAKMVHMLASLPENMVIKNITTFPSIEWH
ncbi:SDR family oxidoreductase [Polynucleobacter sp. Adler-ghost]|uniref:SDR family oxidoreductase n=1 Tax=Polynucleobacter sp. Adler-ghost TaxID=2770234 RepID=UPI001BFE13F8|nr:SDR family oxidoreductase [Polynucleobacter sp. Adler-ghost]QWE31047.1 SDR family oxidoreductase [Polynucleobacter sp. Adler-ghost]